MMHRVMVRLMMPMMRVLEGDALDALSDGAAVFANCECTVGDALGDGEAGDADGEGGAGDATAEGASSDVHGEDAVGDASGDGAAGDADGEGVMVNVPGAGAAGDANVDGAAGDAPGDGAAGDANGEGAEGDKTGDGPVVLPMVKVLQVMHRLTVPLFLPMPRVPHVMHRVTAPLVMPMVRVLQVMDWVMVPLMMPMVRVPQVMQRVLVPLVMLTVRVLQVMLWLMVSLVMTMVRVLQVMFLGAGPRLGGGWPVLRVGSCHSWLEASRALLSSWPAALRGVCCLPCWGGSLTILAEGLWCRCPCFLGGVCRWGRWLIRRHSWLRVGRWFPQGWVGGSPHCVCLWRGWVRVVLMLLWPPSHLTLLSHVTGPRGAGQRGQPNTRSPRPN